jgi:nitroreductase
MPVLAIDHDLNDKIDVIFEARRTVRSFEHDVPEPELIKEVIKAGLLAPYARQAVGDYKDFRRFFIIERGTEAMAKAERMIRDRMKDGYSFLSKQAEENREFARQAGSFLNRMKSISEGAEIGFESAPYFVVVAEKKGFPPVELQSLAHCLENMWLKCVPLGLAFRLISATSQMADDDTFCAFLDIPKSEFGLNGCAIGYPKEVPPPTRRPLLEEAIKWVERR